MQPINGLGLIDNIKRSGYENDVGDIDGNLVYIRETNHADTTCMLDWWCIRIYITFTHEIKTMHIDSRGLLSDALEFIQFGKGQNLQLNRFKNNIHIEILSDYSNIHLCIQTSMNGVLHDIQIKSNKLAIMGIFVIGHSSPEYL
ncbi:hypothetical protein ACJX0J_035979, partial [Zea mays]